MKDEASQELKLYVFYRTISDTKYTFAKQFTDEKSFVNLKTD